MEYLFFNFDDSPLYLFESSFENHKHLKSLMKDCEVHKFFKEDLFQIVLFAFYIDRRKKKAAL